MSVYDVLDKVDEKYDKELSCLKNDGLKAIEEIASGKLEIKKCNNMYMVDISKDHNQDSRFAAAVFYHRYKDNPDIFNNAFNSTGELKFVSYNNCCFYFTRNDKEKNND